MFWLVQILLPLGVAVVLPVMIIWLIMRAKINEDNKRAEVLMDVLKDRSDVDIDALVNAMAKPRKTPEEKQQHRLMLGCGLTLAGIGAAALAWVVYEPQSAIDSPVAFLTAAIVALALGIANLAAYFAGRRK